MSRLLAAIAVCALLFSAHAEEGKKPAPRKTVPIAGGWLVTSEKQEKTKTEGTRTLLFTATGNPTLKRSSKVTNGVVDITGKAQKIECDFVEKKLVLTGSPELRQVLPGAEKATKVIIGEAGTVIEIPLRFGEGDRIEVTGPNKTTLETDGAPGK